MEICLCQVWMRFTKFGSIWINFHNARTPPPCKTAKNEKKVFFFFGSNVINDFHQEYFKWDKWALGTKKYWLGSWVMGGEGGVTHRGTQNVQNNQKTHVIEWRQQWSFFWCEQPKNTITAITAKTTAATTATTAATTAVATTTTATIAATAAITTATATTKKLKCKNGSFWCLGDSNN